MQKITVAIDGPSGSGKSSVSKEAARRLGAAYLDTGAMYRAVTWHALDAGTDLTDAEAVAAAVKAADLFISTDPDVERVTHPRHRRHRGHPRTVRLRRPSRPWPPTWRPARSWWHRQRAIIKATNASWPRAGTSPPWWPPTPTPASCSPPPRRRACAAAACSWAAPSPPPSSQAQVLARDAKDSTVVNFHVAADGVVTVDSSDLDFEQTVATVLEAITAQAA